MSKQRCQAETSSSEFLDWMQYLNLQINAFHREDYFLANIAKLIVQSNSKNPENVKLDPFLLKFENKKPQEVKLDEKSRLERIKQSWLTWASIGRPTGMAKSRRKPKKVRKD